MALVPPPPHAGCTRGRKHSTACQLGSAFSGQGKVKFQHHRHILAECSRPVGLRVVSWPEEGRVQQPPSAETRAAFSLQAATSRVPLYEWTDTRASREVVSSNAGPAVATCQPAGTEAGAGKPREIPPTLDPSPCQHPQPGAKLVKLKKQLSLH